MLNVTDVIVPGVLMQHTHSKYIFTNYLSNFYCIAEFEF